MSARLLALGVLLLSACDTEPAAPQRLAREQLLDPETCKDCHINHYNEWSASMHAYASRDPVFRAMNKRGQEEANLGDFCVKCHAPMAVVENAISDFGDLTTVPDHLQGVTCYFCHNVTGVGEAHNNANLTLANDDIMRGALGNPKDPGVHGVLQSKSAFHDRRKTESAIMCGTCHDIVTPNGTHLERTLAEWKESLFANTDPKAYSFQSCSDCHMDDELTARPAAPGFDGVSARTNHSHLFPAVDVALTPDRPFQAAMRSAVERCELQQRSISYFEVTEGTGSSGWMPGEPYAFTVRLETQAGHAQPSGVANDRRMWLEVVAISGGREVWWSGRIDDHELEEGPGANPDEDAAQLCMFRARFKDAQGQPAHMFWDAVGEPGGKVLPVPKTATPGGHTEECTYQIGTLFQPPDKLKFRLRMRPMGLDVLQDLADSGHLDPSIIANMPTFTMYEREDTFDPARRTWVKGRLPDSDCNEWKCLIDEASPDCVQYREGM